MQVVILDGGFGTRLSEEAALRPKIMVQIGDSLVNPETLSHRSTA